MSKLQTKQMFQKSHERNNMQKLKSFRYQWKRTSCSDPSILCSISLQTRTNLTKPLIKAFLIAVNCKWFHTTPIFYQLSLKLDQSDMSKTSLKTKYGLIVFVAICNIFSQVLILSLFTQKIFNKLSV